MSYEPTDGLLAALDGGVLRLTLDRPAKRNSVTQDMVGALIAHLDAATQDEDVRVVVLDGAGEDFCSGSDLAPASARAARPPRVGTIQRRLPSGANRLIPAMAATQVPIVCVVRGWAAGLGFHLALASDFCVAADTARFWEPFMTRGFTPDSAGAWLIPRLVGMVRARVLLLLGRELSGAEAAEWGLIHRAVPEAELSATADVLVAGLAAAPTVAMGLAKWLLHSGSELDLSHHLQNEALGLELSMRSADFREGLAAFKDKRDPRFEGR